MPRNIALTRMATSRVGIESTVSATRISRLSIQPPKNPAIKPIVTPTAIETATAAKPMINDTRVP